MIVLGTGRLPNTVLLVGDTPNQGEVEPFTGKAGKEQEMYLSRHQLTAKTWYRTNLIKEYTEGNTDPTPAQIEEWEPVLLDEIEQCRPRLVVTVGRVATQWFLGDVSMDAVHGLPHRSDKAPDAVIVPTYHPAFGYFSNDSRALISADYAQVASSLIDLQTEQLPEFAGNDCHEGDEDYSDVSGEEMASNVSGLGFFGLDTEGVPSDPWSIQISIAPGTGMVLRCSQPDFQIGINALQQQANQGAEFIIHNAMYDIEMSRVMGLELSRAPIWDSMYAAYIMRLEPQGLKALAYRWLGMKMNSYMETVGGASLDKQVDYLVQVYLDEWPELESQIKYLNDGTAKVYNPWSITRRAESILQDVYLKGGIDVYGRWSKLDTALKHIVEERYGEMIFDNLGDIPLEDAVYYSARDADAAIRMYLKLVPELKSRGLDTLMAQGMEVLPIFEEMQYKGMPASHSYFYNLENEMTEEMDKLQARISTLYYGGQPFNPMSSTQVATIMRRRGLVGEKRTSTGAVSTAKKSIEHLRDSDDAISDIFDWRERQKVRDTYCRPIQVKIQGGDDLQYIHCQIKTTRVATRRLATSDPNLLGMPSRSSLGLRVREGFKCVEGEVFGGWDLSQVEMRYAAHISQDKLLIERICRGADIHSETAADIFRTPLDKVTKPERTAAKTTGFGILYGIGPPGLKDSFRAAGVQGWENEADCAELIKGWLEVYNGIRDYREQCKDELRKAGVVRDVWGMPRYLPGVWAREAGIRAEAERVAFSHRVQGGAQGMIQQSMAWLRPQIIDLQEAGFNIHWALQIHDELIFRFDEDLWDVIDPLVREALTEHCGLELSVPLDADGGMSKTWGGLK